MYMLPRDDVKSSASYPNRQTHARANVHAPAWYWMHPLSATVSWTHRIAGHGERGADRRVKSLAAEAAAAHSTPLR